MKNKVKILGLKQALAYSKKVSFHLEKVKWYTKKFNDTKLKAK